MAKYDVETLMDEILLVMTTNLNTKIAGINDEKDDDLVLKEIPTDAFFLQELNGKTANFNPFVFYAVDDIQGGGGYSYTPSKMSVVVALCVSDMGEDLQIGPRMFRYWRALKEIFEDTFVLPESGAKLSIISQVPVSIKLLNSASVHRAIGVTLQVEFG